MKPCAKAFAWPSVPECPPRDLGSSSDYTFDNEELGASTRDVGPARNRGRCCIAASDCRPPPAGVVLGEGGGRCLVQFPPPPRRKPRLLRRVAQASSEG